MNYREQYNHPLWQGKRIEIFQRDGLICSNCGNDQVQLHVHHKEYIKGRKVWEYDNSNFVVLCDTCHKEVHGISKQIIGESKYSHLIEPIQLSAVAIEIASQLKQLEERLKNCKDQDEETEILKQVMKLQAQKRNIK